MTDTMTHLTTRVPQQVIEALDDLARQRRMQTGDDVRRADLVREALVNMAAGGSMQPPAKPAGQSSPSMLSQVINCPDERESIRLALEVLAQLAHDAQHRGLLTNPAVELGMAVFAACEDRQDNDLLTDYVSKLHGALRAL